MRTPLAWLDLLYYGKRSAVAVLGLCMAITAIFMQLGFYEAAIGTATLIYDRLEFDVLLVSRTYVCLLLPGTIPRARMLQAASVPGVQSATPFYTGFKLWRDPATKQRLRMLVLGSPLKAGVYRLPALGPFLEELTRPDTVAIDTLSLPQYGPQDPGLIKEVGGRRIKIVGGVKFGAGFTAYGTVFTSDQNFARLFDGYPLNMVSLGLLRIMPGVNVGEIVERLRATLPPDTQILSRAEMNVQEARFWKTVSPIGQLFAAGSVVAFLVGLIIVTQMLTTDVAMHLSEYATLKAMGYRDGYLFRTVFTKIGLIALLAYGPALVGSLAIYEAARAATNLPMEMTLTRVVLVFTLTLLIAFVAGLFALRRVMAADPADLF